MRIALVLVALSLLLAGCASDPAPSTGTSPASTSPAGTTPAATTPAATTPVTSTPATTTPVATTPVATTPAGEDGENVDVQGFAFQPQDITVPVGTEVRWRNRDAAPHTATADDGAFDSGTLATDAEYRFTFTQAGVFPYHCEIHPRMMGNVTVTG